ncbi:MAG: fatty acid desaturase [Pseudomonadota bacterium]
MQPVGSLEDVSLRPDEVASRVSAARDLSGEPKSIASLPDIVAKGLTPYKWKGVYVAGCVFAIWTLHLGWTLTSVPSFYWGTPFHIIFQAFLNVGLFITAHDAIHGVLAPGRKRLNNFIGSAALFLYGAFLWEKMHDNHHAHHRAPATAEDPDYEVSERPLNWLGAFFVRYYSWRNLLLTYLHVGIVYVISGSFADLMVYWAVPAWLSAVQLFVFGVYLPHRKPKGGHTHAHRAVSLDFPEWLSFITCYHFGYHQEHHDYPYVPWWRLPKIRRAVLASQAA